jgi:hypothetical protein
MRVRELWERASWDERGRVWMRGGELGGEGES